MESRGLKLVLEKTEAMLARGRRVCEVTSIHFQGWEVKPNKTIKILGVTCDKDITFNHHLVQTAEQATKMTT